MKFTYYVYKDILNSPYVLSTNSFQTAIDRWTECVTNGDKESYIKFDNLSNGVKTYLRNREEIKKWAEHLLNNNYNRVEKRIILDGIVPEGEPMTDKPNFHGDFGKISKEEQDQIINPKHYKILPVEAMTLFLNKGMEYMDIMRYALKRHKGVFAHVLGQVFKYSFRIGGKDDELQDAKKIAWYANRLVEEIEFERGITTKKPRGEYCADIVDTIEKVSSTIYTDLKDWDESEDNYLAYGRYHAEAYYDLQKLYKKLKGEA